MNEIIDNEPSKSNLPDLPTILKWILIGALGCTVFQSFEYLLQVIVTDILIKKANLGITTIYFIEHVVTLIPVLIVFASVIKSFKEKYYKNEVNIKRTIKRLIIAYVICTVLSIIYSFISDLLISHSASEVTDVDPLSYLFFGINIFYIVEVFIKYGFVAWILLRKE